VRLGRERVGTGFGRKWKGGGGKPGLSWAALSQAGDLGKQQQASTRDMQVYVCMLGGGVRHCGTITYICQQQPG
jgi:hypothetical protein